MKRIFQALILLAFSFSAYGQSTDFTFGSVPESDLKMKLYPGDEEAEALILYDKAEVSFVLDKTENQINIQFNRRIRIKILKSDALALGDVQIGYFKSGFNRNQSVFNIKAYSHGINDGAYQRREINKDDIFDEQINDEYHVKKVTIPNVKVGSVIEYEYSLIIPNSTVIPDWNFQNRYPTRISEYQVSLIPFYEYTYLLQGRKKFSSTSSKKETIKRNYAGIEFTDMTYNFVMKNLPAFKDETYITSREDYIIKLDWQLTDIHYPDGRSKQFMSTWPEISNQMLKSEYFGKFLQAAERSNKKRIASELGLNGLSDLQKAEKITKHVKDKFEWNGYYQKYTDLSVKEFANTQEGSSAEINLYLTGMLRAAGLEANPVLISTRGHGKIKDEFALVSFFNASVVMVNIEGSYYLVDGTDPLLPFGWLPAECINEKGLIITKNSESWIDLSAEPISSIQENLSLKLDPVEGLVTGAFKKSMTGYDALIYKRNPKRIEGELQDFELDGEIKKSNEEDNGLPFILEYEAEVAGIDVYGDMINLRPFLNKPWGSNPLKSRRRSYPVDLIYKRQREYISTIEIPEGYMVLTLPEPKELDDPLVKVSYKTSQNDNVLTVEASYLFKKSVYEPREYTKIREHINLFIEKFNEQIVFKKKE